MPSLKLDCSGINLSRNCRSKLCKKLYKPQDIISLKGLIYERLVTSRYSWFVYIQYFLLDNR